MDAAQIAKLSQIGPDGLTGETRAQLPEQEWLQAAIQRMDYLLAHPDDPTNRDSPETLTRRRDAYRARLDALGA